MNEEVEDRGEENEVLFEGFESIGRSALRRFDVKAVRTSFQRWLADLSGREVVCATSILPFMPSCHFRLLSLAPGGWPTTISRLWQKGVTVLRDARFWSFGHGALTNRWPKSLSGKWSTRSCSVRDATLSRRRSCACRNANRAARILPVPLLQRSSVSSSLDTIV